MEQHQYHTRPTRRLPYIAKISCPARDHGTSRQAQTRSYQFIKVSIAYGFLQKIWESRHCSGLRPNASMNSIAGGAAPILLPTLRQLYIIQCQKKLHRFMLKSNPFHFRLFVKGVLFQACLRVLQARRIHLCRHAAFTLAEAPKSVINVDALMWNELACPFRLF
ncbi:uncharacterized protein BDW70DRAFT_48141 [Aspergillus foveolatus]|uniref:uncharacterized protein n=1 Tax=Aspergillus foveolatus TaxID=210207 RepID=UPI003CCD0A0A